MGEERQDATEHPTKRATVGEAAGLLGITAEAVRSRIKRGTLRSIKEGATVYVLLVENDTHGFQSTDRNATEHDRTDAQTSPEPDQTSDRAELVNVLRDQVEYLREQLGEEREARRRADHIIAGLSEVTANLAGQVRELTAPDRGPQEPESVSEGASPRSDTAGAQEGVQEHSANAERPTGETARRPWWVRWFGG